MPIAPLRLIRRCFEFAQREGYWTVPAETRGIDVLYRRRRLPRRLCDENDLTSCS
jgi:hypothetical protein